MNLWSGGVPVCLIGYMWRVRCEALILGGQIPWSLKISPKNPEIFFEGEHFEGRAGAPETDKGRIGKEAPRSGKGIARKGDVTGQGQ